MLQSLLLHINYYLKARSSLYIHSPFVFDFCQNMLYADKEFYAFGQISAYQKRMTTNREVLYGDDAGKGSRNMLKSRTVAHYAKVASMPSKYGKVLFKSVLHHKAENILELGTCLGIGTAYLAMANPEATIVTIEGNKALAEKAREGIAALGITNVKVLNALFENILPELKNHLPGVDMAFIDGNHTYNATLSYFETLLPYTHAKTTLIFDDIHWSADMFKAWKHIVQHPLSTLSINIGRMGFVWLDPTLPKQAFILRY